MTTSTNDAAETAGKIIGVGLLLAMILAFLFVTVVVGFINAWVIRDLWRWFISPVFGLPALPLVNAYGLFLLASCFTGGLAKQSTLLEMKEDREGWVDTIALPITKGVLAALLIWTIGALIHRYGAPWPWNGVA